MRILISPAKKMHADTEDIAVTLPYFLSEARQIKKVLQSLAPCDLQTLWGCNQKITELNYERVCSMNLKQRLTPAIFAYEGLQYQYMAPRVLEEEALNFLSEHLRILSGFYGLLSPFDGITPYRLEMQAKLRIGTCRDLYAFWHNKLAELLCRETSFIVNLASKEYSKCLLPFLPQNILFLTCTFGERIADKIVEKGTICKMARGEMVRFLSETKGTTPEAVEKFDRLGYKFNAKASTKTNYVFLKGGN